ncbi:glycosyltransferase [Antarcticirhabdus aurantiaca]|uniref:Glycosyltransferase n=1 Tax=Antarcticirhabdus aurantiaca TaxID=2606717 RepID=A0ACD4NLG9_9HYPH|nr:glycosyltransferase [Antarcticirhabdus aurantiaca]WAJ27693.1 glycosyltransferase [Jeongeuplla avenae]
MSTRLLRSAWRRLPRGFRQDLFARLTERLVPAVPAAELDPAVLPAPITVVGALRAPTGLGQAARLALHALREAGVPFAAIDITARLSQPETEPVFEAPAAREGPGTLLVYAVPPNGANALAAVPREIRAGKRLAAGWVCETEALPALWQRQARLFHVLTAPTRFAADGIARATGRPVRVIGHPVLAEPLPPVPQDPPRSPDGRRLVGAVLDVASSGDRKNVEALIETIRRLLASSNDVGFRLKIKDAGAEPALARALAELLRSAPDRIAVAEAAASRAETIGFIDGLDLLLSLARAEGFGLPHAEAIMRGVPVAAARWSGPAEFLTDENSVALPFRLVPIRDRSGLYAPTMGRWAEIDPGAAAEAVLRALEAPPRLRPPMPPLFTTRLFVDALLGRA